MREQHCMVRTLRSLALVKDTDGAEPCIRAPNNRFTGRRRFGQIKLLSMRYNACVGRRRLCRASLLVLPWAPRLAFARACHSLHADRDASVSSAAGVSIRTSFLQLPAGILKHDWKCHTHFPRGKTCFDSNSSFHGLQCDTVKNVK